MLSLSANWLILAVVLLIGLVSYMAWRNISRAVTKMRDEHQKAETKRQTDRLAEIVRWEILNSRFDQNCCTWEGEENERIV